MYKNLCAGSLTIPAISDQPSNDGAAVSDGFKFPVAESIVSMVSVLAPLRETVKRYANCVEASATGPTAKNAAEVADDPPGSGPAVIVAVVVATLTPAVSPVTVSVTVNVPTLP